MSTTLVRAALLLMVAPSWFAFADPPGPPPPEIRAIFQKLHAGQRPSDDEQRQLREWMANGNRGAAAQNDPEAGAVPDDVAAIMAKLRETGQKPSDAELGRLKAWAAEKEANKGKILEQTKQREAELRREGTPLEGRPRGPVSDVPMGYVAGEVRLTYTSTLRSQSKTRRSMTTLNGQARFQVWFKLNEPIAKQVTSMPKDAWSLSWAPDPKGASSGSQQLHSEETSGSRTVTVDAHTDGNGTMASGALASGELFTAPSLARPGLRGSYGLQGRTVGKSTTVDTDGTNSSSFDGAGALPGAALTMDEARLDVPWATGGGVSPGIAKTYGVAAALGPELKSAIEGTQVSCSLEALHQAFGQQGTHQTTCSTRYSLTNTKGDERVSQDVSGSVTFVLRPEKSDLVVRPEDPAAYDVWLPTPWTDDDVAMKAFGVGKHDEKVVLKVFAGWEKAAKTCQLDISLRDVSNNKGLCTNYPTKASADKGLVIVPGQPGLVIDSDGQHAVTKEPVRSVTVKVAAKDAGGYGKVVVTCSADGTQAKEPRTGDLFMRVPKDDNDNHIADAWRGDASLNYTRTDDKDEKPTEWTRKGDGYSVWEEYRGFLVTPTHQTVAYERFDPTQRDLLVAVVGPDILEELRAGVLTYEGITKVKVHFVDLPELLLQPTGARQRSRWANFNTAPEDTRNGSGLRQRAVRVESDSGDDMYTKPDGVPEDARLSPDVVDVISISVSGGQSVFDSLWSTMAIPVKPLPLWQQARDQLAKGAPPLWGGQPVNIDLRTLHRSMSAQRAELARRLLVFATAHELGHATGARHHGLDDAMVDFQQADAVLELAKAQAEAAKDPKAVAAAEAAKNKANWKTQDDTFGQGAADCPMRYWHFGHGAKEKLLFAAGIWSPPDVSPNKTPWTFCDADVVGMRLVQQQ